MDEKEVVSMNQRALWQATRTISSSENGVDLVELVAVHFEVLSVKRKSLRGDPKSECLRSLTASPTRRHL
jgi:hypothetical protein